MADTLNIISISLVPNDFALETTPMAFNEAFIRCQYYYQSSFPLYVLPSTNSGLNTAYIAAQTSAPSTPGSRGPTALFETIMRVNPSCILYNPAAANNEIVSGGGQSWSLSVADSITTKGFGMAGTTPAISNVGNDASAHWTADARLGI